MTNSALFLAVFLACAVEAVEALTIILAAGAARDWRSANTGLLAGLATLAAVVAAARTGVVRDSAGRLAGVRRRSAADLRAAMVTQGDPARQRS